LRLDKHVYSNDTIVIGGGLNALLYSFFTGYPCICVESIPPFRFDNCSDECDFRFLYLESKNCRKAWERLIFLLGLGGQLPMTNRASAINIRDNLLKVATPNSRLGRFEFKKLVVFSDKNMLGLPPVKKQTVGRYRVLDWFNVRSGMEHQHDLFETSEDFIRRVYFYPSDRFGVQKKERVRKDLVAESYLDHDQLDDFEYSDTMARFKIISMMKEKGMRGARNGRDTYNPKLYRYYSVKIEPTEREIIPDVKTYYEDDERFEFCYDTPEEIINKYGNNIQNYTSKLNDFLLSNSAAL